MVKGEEGREGEREREIVISLIIHSFISLTAPLRIGRWETALLNTVECF
uniref:Uncharacterized protein n=1 Tax=Anguilla anguilla TaxID=7936 RepID=A0A0E9S1M4_ANGAN